MNEKLMLVIFAYYLMVGMVGGFSLDLNYDNVLTDLWKELREKYKIIGCILIYIIIHPAILLILFINIISWISNKVFDLFEIVFKKGE